MGIVGTYDTYVLAVDADGELWEVPTNKSYSKNDTIQVIWQRGDIAIKGE